MELNEESPRKRGRPLGSKKRKKALFTRIKKHKFSSSFKPEPPDDSDDSHHSENSSSNYNQWRGEIPHLTLNWTPSIFKEDLLEEEEDDETADCPQDSEESVLQTARESSSSDDGDDSTRAAECDDAFIVVEGPENSAGILDGKRIRRSSKKTKDANGCPVCGITLREPDLEPHFAHEVDRLSNIPRKYKKFRNEDGINNSFVQVKCNRENRVRAKFARCVESAPKKVQCPICKERITGTESEVNDHVVCCADNDTQVNVEDDDYESSYEELEIGNETRIRTASLVRGGYRSLFGQSCVIRNEEDSNTDIVVDVDDTKEFGSPQYTELDVISDFNQDDEKRELLRRSVISDPDAKPNVIAERKWSDTPDVEEVIEPSVAVSESEGTKNDEPFPLRNERDKSEDGSVHSKTLIHSLKQRIQFLEKQNKNTITCLICLEPYSTPLVSTTCWHVHCEECWLKNMGEKKLCPQCNMIVCPSNLRKIYL